MTEYYHCFDIDCFVFILKKLANIRISYKAITVIFNIRCFSCLHVNNMVDNIEKDKIYIASC